MTGKLPDKAFTREYRGMIAQSVSFATKLCLRDPIFYPRVCRACSPSRREGRYRTAPWRGDVLIRVAADPERRLDDILPWNRTQRASAKAVGVGQRNRTPGKPDLDLWPRTAGSRRSPTLAQMCSMP